MQKDGLHKPQQKQKLKKTVYEFTIFTHLSVFLAIVPKLELTRLSG